MFTCLVSASASSLFFFFFLATRERFFGELISQSSKVYRRRWPNTLHIFMQKHYETISGNCFPYTKQKKRRKRLYNSSTDSIPIRTLALCFIAWVMSPSHWTLVFSVGLNCSLGARELWPYLDRVSKSSQAFVLCYPNAGKTNTLAHKNKVETPFPKGTFTGGHFDSATFREVIFPWSHQRLLAKQSSVCPTCSRPSIPEIIQKL